MDEKKNGSQALETTGTDLSAITNISTSSTVYQGESYAKAEMDAVNIVVVNSQSNFHSGNCDGTYLETKKVVELSLGKIPERRPQNGHERELEEKQAPDGRGSQ